MMPTEHDEARMIPLTMGKVAIVDAADFDALSAYKWCAMQSGNGKFRAMRKGPRNGGSGAAILMHRLVMSAPEGVKVDHINHDPLDNRRSNLRLCTHAENLRNVTSYRESSSQYLGVSWHKARGKWTAQIEIDGRKKHLGYFTEEAAAALTYDAAARAHYGAFANPNFKDDRDGQ